MRDIELDFASCITQDLATAREVRWSLSGIQSELGRGFRLQTTRDIASLEDVESLGDRGQSTIPVRLSFIGIPIFTWAAGITRISESTVREHASNLLLLRSWEHIRTINVDADGRTWCRDQLRAVPRLPGTKWPLKLAIGAMFRGRHRRLRSEL